MIQLISFVMTVAGIILVDVSTGNHLLAVAILLVLAGHEFHLKDAMDRNS